MTLKHFQLTEHFHILLSFLIRLRQGGLVMSLFHTGKGKLRQGTGFSEITGLIRWPWGGQGWCPNLWERALSWIKHSMHDTVLLAT